MEIGWRLTPLFVDQGVNERAWDVGKRVLLYGVTSPSLQAKEVACANRAQSVLASHGAYAANICQLLNGAVNTIHLRPNEVCRSNRCDFSTPSRLVLSLAVLHA
ncbi:hypothetical protein CAOG_01535 [Capsaspora owczarzaki ATCC 30864]|uniref:Uncharacterized protein n=1 Tax=Capsaspora owczarzaki (strain ATCC 30864) TaxID=595528 RepID=A0A0D2VJN2_CAPO3|nr:hypothetical protein CAOG_01535 [Capsaspora owczarzaki ATCC 30864]KJE90192.1 hypothetical protein CAOG_001535 [Capsaspora owczarzaki ATCC 30864]|eukprot:XP_004364403.1 hypothetical protein CAOG_01535 [Capsaspora owczarzaki ATCC 30864]